MSTITSSACPTPSALKKLYNTLLLAGLDHTARTLEMRDPACHQAELHCVQDEALIATLKEEAEVQELLNCLKPKASDPTECSVLAASQPPTTSSIFTSVLAEGQPKNLSVAWYFAYGSNMSAEQAKVRLGKTYGRELLHLPGHKLVFNKSSVQPGLAYANVQKCSTVAERTTEENKNIKEADSPSLDLDLEFSRQVFGVGYQLTVDQLLRMDHFEGVHFGQYRRERVQCTLASGPQKGQSVTAFIYFAQSTVDLKQGNGEIEILPSAEYLGRISEGADILPEDYASWVRQHRTSRIRSPRQEMRLRKEL